MERTLVIVKPDGVQRGLVGEVITRLERRGLKLVALKLTQVSQTLAREHYAVHEGKPFYEGLIEYITASPVVVMVWQGNRVIEVVRATMGLTDPSKAAPGTVRADYGLEIGRNLTHASDGPDTAATELALWFGPSEVVDWERAIDRWVFE